MSSIGSFLTAGLLRNTNEPRIHARYSFDQFRKILKRQTAKQPMVTAPNYESLWTINIRKEVEGKERSVCIVQSCKERNESTFVFKRIDLPADDRPWTFAGTVQLESEHSRTYVSFGWTRFVSRPILGSVSVEHADKCDANHITNQRICSSVSEWIGKSRLFNVTNLSWLRLRRWIVLTTAIRLPLSQSVVNMPRVRNNWK